MEEGKSILSINHGILYRLSHSKMCKTRLNKINVNLAIFRNYKQENEISLTITLVNIYLPAKFQEKLLDLFLT